MIQKTTQEPSQRGHLKARAYAVLKENIINGHYPPGSFLSERILVSQLDMSKTPIRAALERLESEGFVTVSPQQGIVVREPSLRELLDQFEIRLALEAYVFRAISGKLSEAQISQTQKNLVAQRIAAEREDLEKSIRLDGEFHLMFCEFLGNREILAVMKALREKIVWLIRLVFHKDQRRMRPNWQEHQQISEAVVSGDAERAVRLLDQHFEYGKRALLNR
jgi:DNA-binding GntR family transcriptional regulator